MNIKHFDKVTHSEVAHNILAANPDIANAPDFEDVVDASVAENIVAEAQIDDTNVILYQDGVVFIEESFIDLNKLKQFALDLMKFEHHIRANEEQKELFIDEIDNL